MCATLVEGRGVSPHLVEKCDSPASLSNQCERMPVARKMDGRESCDRKKGDDERHTHKKRRESVTLTCNCSPRVSSDSLTESTSQLNGLIRSPVLMSGCKSLVRKSTVNAYIPAYAMCMCIYYD